MGWRGFHLPLAIHPLPVYTPAVTRAPVDRPPGSQTVRRRPARIICVARRPSRGRWGGGSWPVEIRTTNRVSRVPPGVRPGRHQAH